MSKYSNDEFDRVPEFTDRNGVHRAESAGAASRSGLGPLMGVGALALLVGLFSFLVLPQFTGAPAAAPGNSTDASSVTSGAPESAEPSETETPEPAESKAAESEAPESEEAEESTEASPTDDPAEAEGGVELSTPVGVYNGAARAGLAASGAAGLRGGGFTAVSTSNWTKQVEYSVVYYRADSSRATAEEAARVLGIATVFQTPNIPVEISVVLGRNYG